MKCIASSQRPCPVEPIPSAPPLPPQNANKACVACSSSLVTGCSAYTFGDGGSGTGTTFTAADVCPEGSTKAPVCTECSASYYLVGAA